MVAIELGQGSYRPLRQGPAAGPLDRPPFIRVRSSSSVPSRFPSPSIILFGSTRPSLRASGCLSSTFVLPTAAGILPSQIHPDKAAHPSPSKSHVPFWSPCPIYSLSRAAFPFLGPQISLGAQSRVRISSLGFPRRSTTLVPPSGTALVHSRAPHSHVPFSNRKRLEDYRIRIRREEGEGRREEKRKRKRKRKRRAYLGAPVLWRESTSGTRRSTGR